MGGGQAKSIRAEYVLDLLDAAYDMQATPGEWLRKVAQVALRTLDFGYGLHAHLFDASSPGKFELLSPIGVGLSPEWERCWRSNWWDVFMAPLDATMLRTMHGYGVCTYATDVWDAATSRFSDYASYLDRLATHGYGRTHAKYVISAEKPTGDKLLYPDSFNLVVHDGTGKGCALVANLPEPIRPWSRDQIGLLGRTANHLAAGLRLQLRHSSAQGRGLDDAELILGDRGQVVHASGPAERSHVRAQLHRTLVEVEQSKRRESRIPADAVLECWRALHHGRWSVLDQFDTDGRHFIVARPNVPACAGPLPSGLSDRESQVALLVEAGHSNKTIAYELGLSESTVATHVRRIMAKVGADSRVSVVTRLKAGRLQGG
jgi:DNA-binding CsgD family transcriptional regulator